MDTIKFECTVQTSDTNQEHSPLCVSVLLNGDVLYPEQQITAKSNISIEIPDEDDKNWTVTIVVSGKQLEHTQLDIDGNVISDVYLEFTNFKIDEVDISSIIVDSPWKYTHNFNGFGSETVDKFVDIAGCNGTIEFNFTTPFYLWLLENM